MPADDPDPIDPALAAQGLGFVPPGAPVPDDVPTGVTLQSGETTTPAAPPPTPPAPAAPAPHTEFTPPGIPPTPDAAAAAAAAPDAGSFAPPPMPSEQAPETAR